MPHDHPHSIPSPIRVVPIGERPVYDNVQVYTPPPTGPHFQSPSVLILMIDDIGPEFYSVYDVGSSTPKARTPNLNALIADSVLFTNAFSSTVCSPTRGQLQTGLYPHRIGLGTTNTGPENPTFRLADSLVWLPEAVRDGAHHETYARAAWGKWHMCTPIPFPRPNFNDGHPKDNGWDRYAGQMINAGGNAANGDFDHYIWRRVTNDGPTVATAQIGSTTDFLPFGAAVPPTNASYANATNYDAGHNARDLVAWANAQTTPWLSYLCFNPPHAPYQVPPFEYLSTETVTALTQAGLTQGQKINPAVDLARGRLVFLAAMEAVDHWIGWIFSPNGLAPEQRRSLVTIAIGDNGTAGDIINEAEDAPFRISHSKRTVFEQAVRVPCFVHGSAVIDPGRVSSDLVHAIDIFATVLELTDSKDDDAGVTETDSISFHKAIKNDPPHTERDRIWTHTFTPNGAYPNPAMTRDNWALRDERWKITHLFANNIVREQLFDLSVDPWEDNDLLLGALTPEQQEAFTRLQGEAATILALAPV